MSRIGTIPLNIPDKVDVKIAETEIEIKGPKGSLTQDYKPVIKIETVDNNIIINRKDDSKQARAYHGLYRRLIENMVKGVTEGFKKTLLINGVGYRAEVKGNILTLNLGYSNPVEYLIKEGITITCEGNTKLVVEGIDKQQVGQTSAEIRSVRPPEPYKGKGVRYEDEYVRRKIGKTGVK